MTIEQATRAEWHKWGSGYSMFCTCDGCDEFKACRGVRRSRMLCLDCFDLGKEKGRRKAAPTPVIRSSRSRQGGTDRAH